MKRERHWTWWMMLFYMIGQALVGVMGVYDPSPSLNSLDLVDLYSILSVIFAAIGVVGLFRRPKVVMWAIYGMALGAMVHGASIMLLPTGPLMMIPMGHIWWRYSVLESVLNRRNES